MRVLMKIELRQNSDQCEESKSCAIFFSLRNKMNASRNIFVFRF